MADKKLSECTDSEIASAFMAMLNRHDGAFARGEELPYYFIGDETEEDEDAERVEGRRAVEVYLEKRTAARLEFDEDGRLTKIERLDF